MMPWLAEPNVAPPPGPPARPGASPVVRRWIYRTAGFRALGHDFAVLTTDVMLGRWLDRLFANLRSPGVPATVYGFATDGPPERPYAVYANDELLTASERPACALRYLSWHVNVHAGRSAAGVVVHAAGAERDGIGVLLPAASGHGKSTLVAGLVRAGFRYLSDEAVSVDPTTSLLQPFPKPIALRPGSWEALAELRPDLDEPLAPYACDEWLVDPCSIRPGAIAPPSHARLVVFPRFLAGASTQLEPMGRAEAVCELAGQTFDFRASAPRNLAVLADLVRSCSCYRLEIGDLTAACDLLGGLVNDLLHGKGDDDS
ncbi:MAG: hypothetical protein M3252_04615 [Actinomycetota bacterium]|nr:hypothetical protein [Actinomycetota bacterium]